MLGARTARRLRDQGPPGHHLCVLRFCLFACYVLRIRAGIGGGPSDGEGAGATALLGRAASSSTPRWMAWGVDLCFVLSRRWCNPRVPAWRLRPLPRGDGDASAGACGDAHGEGNAWRTPCGGSKGLHRRGLWPCWAPDKA